jgi:NAD(P)-dependent dehydrogenase (short-subunit alcohol dehydrogenase family)
MDLGLTGQVAVVTGASRGIGLAVVRALVDEGARVVAGARSSSEELEVLAKTGAVQPVEVDLADEHGPSTLVAHAGDQLDVLVNNVGAAPPRVNGFVQAPTRSGTRRSTSISWLRYGRREARSQS